MATSAQTRDVALDHYADRQRFVNATSEVVTGMWAEVDPDRIVNSWSAMLPEATAVVSGAQLGAARSADGYLDEALDAQDIDPAAVATVDPSAFAGVASDGGALISLLANPVVVTLLSIQDGMDVARALGMGRTNLDMLARTQVADAGRLADQVAITTRPRASGYVRVAVGKSCARCLLLAGREYRWNTGFKRHPVCDCIHLPTAAARAGGLVQHPREIYNSMNRAERLRAGFTLADQRAIAAGADLDQVINVRHRPESLPTAGQRARRSQRATTTVGTTRRSLAGLRLQGAPRLTVDEIYRVAGDNRDEVLRLLHRNGYILNMPGVPISGAVSVPSVTVSPSLPAAVPGATGGAAAAVVTVRPVLAATRTRAQVADVMRAEYQRITGRTLNTVEFHGAVQTAREHAEGLLRAAERFPDVNLVSVTRGNSTAYAQAETWAGLPATKTLPAIPSGGRISFNDLWTRDRARYLDSLNNDVGRGWHPAGTNSPMAAAVHEFGHVLDLSALSAATRDDMRALIFRRATQRDLLLDAGPISPADFVAGRGAEGLIRREIGEYALKNESELVAEAFADVIVNGPAASRLSREIVDLLEAEYRRGGRRAGIAAVSPTTPAPDLSKMTVVQLRALAKAQGLKGYSRMVKADLIKTLSPAAAPAVVQDIARMTVVQLRTLARDRGLRGYSRMNKADLQAALRAPVPVGPTSTRIAGRDLTDETRDAAWIRRAELRQQPGDHQDHVLTEMVRRQQGWTTPGHVVTREQFDQAVKSGWTETWRGVHDVIGARGSPVARDIAEATRTGQWGMGQGIYGNGVYVSARRTTAEQYRNSHFAPAKRKSDPLWGPAPLYEWLPGMKPQQSGRGGLMRIALDPSARIIDYEDLQREHVAYLRSIGFQHARTPYERALYDTSFFATMRGYDGVRVHGPMHNDGAQYPPRVANRDEPPQYIIFNRSVLIFEKASRRFDT